MQQFDAQSELDSHASGGGTSSSASSSSSAATHRRSRHTRSALQAASSMQPTTASSSCSGLKQPHATTTSERWIERDTGNGGGRDVAATGQRRRSRT